MANQAKTSTLDPSQERKASPWKQYDQTPSSKLPKIPSEPPARSEYDQSFQDLLAQFGRELTRPESKPVRGEFALDNLAEPAHIDLAYEPPKELDDPGLHFPPILPMRGASELKQFTGVPDLFPGAFKPPEPLVPAIPPEEVERRKKTKQASILTLSGQLKSLAGGLTQVPIDLGNAGIEGTKYNWRIAVGAPAPTEQTNLNSRTQRKQAKENQLSNAIGEVEPVSKLASEHLTKEMLTAAHERIATERQRVEQEEEQMLAAKQAQEESTNLVDPLAATGAKQKRRLLGMFGAWKKKAQTWFTGLKNKFVQLGQVIKKWLSGEQQAANRQG